MTKDKIPTEGELSSGRRHKRQDMERSMGGRIERALVELITNSDDSYRDLEEVYREEGKQVSGKIRIEIERRKKRHPSIVRVRDRAAGMNRLEMYNKICRLGERTSGFERGKARRGLHGRGAKDVSAFGVVHFESIKDGEYNHLIIYPSTRWEFTESKPKKATQEMRNKLGIPKDNGTVVTIEVEGRFPIAQHEKLVRDFSRYYSLRDIFANNSREVKIVDLNQDREDPLIYRYPLGEEVFNSNFTIPNYPNAIVYLIIRKHKTPFEQDYSSPYREGILLKSAATIHECTYFRQESEPFSWRFTGELYCEFIDILAREYDDREDANPDYPNHPENNPLRLLDPLRYGLTPVHPFTEALYKKCKEILQDKINELKAAEELPKRDVTDESLERKLDSLSKEISKVFEKKLIELEEEISTEDIDGSIIKKLGVGLHIIPFSEKLSIKIKVNQPKTFSIIVKDYEALDESLPIEVISSNPDEVEVLSSPVFLKKVKEDERIGRTTFAIESSKVGAEAYIEAYYSSYNNSVHVKIIEQPPPIILPDGLSFEKRMYHLRINKEKTLTLWLKISTKLDNPIIAEIYSNHPEVVVKGGGKCGLRATDAPGVLRGNIRILGRQIQAKGILTARVNGFEQANTRIIVEEREPKSGVKLKFELRDEDFGIVRYKWDEQKPHLLLIGAKHPSIRRYLGEPIGQEYPGINSELYHSVLAEVIAEALAFKLLETHFKNEYHLDYSATEYRYHKHFSDFLIIAHDILVAEPIIK